MSSQQTKNTFSTLQFKQFIKKYFNYPMLLLAIVSIFNFRNILSAFKGIFLFPSIYTILTLIATLAPIGVLVLLYLDRFKKIKKVGLWIGLLLLVATFVKVYINMNMFSTFFAGIPEYDFYILLAETSFILVLKTILESVIFFLLSISLLLNKKPFVFYYIFIVLAIITTLFFGILLLMTGLESIISYFITVLYFIALWFVPKAVNNSHSADITSAQGKALLTILAVALFVFIVAFIATGGAKLNTSSSSDDGERYNSNDELYSSHDYNNDGKINQSEWEDALGEKMDELMGR